MNSVLLIIQLISGAVGGNVVGALVKKFSMGTFLNSIAGILGGGIGGQMLSLLGLPVAKDGGMDIGSIIASIASGGVGGGALIVITELIRAPKGHWS